MAEAADAAPEARLGAAVGAVGVSPAELGRVLLGGGGAGAEDVSGATAAYVADGGSLLADLGAGEFLVEGEDRALGFGVSVAGTAPAGVETAGAGGGGSSGGRDTGGSGGLRSTEEVASTATARVGVAVLGNGGVRLGDGVERRHFGG